MDEEVPSPTRQPYSDGEFDSTPAEPSEARDYSSTAEMTDDYEKEEVHPSVETDSDSMAGEKTDRYSRSDDGEQAVPAAPWARTTPAPSLAKASTSTI
ncbi:hypothetical protein O1611_g5325 [Lasiodiplodia mahajangana]|uniref:Uncharacterized protein n=1 Tax=Lasiodiplodia mahajangana TaxID=1108764 RepID=A0ACC2JLI7_9PEZI|nr:hypothetical protein O1611_g5325 [Lasiodiplodia mahajangana]